MSKCFLAQTMVVVADGWLFVDINVSTVFSQLVISFFCNIFTHRDVFRHPPMVVIFKMPSQGSMSVMEQLSELSFQRYLHFFYWRPYQCCNVFLFTRSILISTQRRPRDVPVYLMYRHVLLRELFIAKSFVYICIC